MAPMAASEESFALVLRGTWENFDVAKFGGRNLFCVGPLCHFDGLALESEPLVSVPMVAAAAESAPAAAAPMTAAEWALLLESPRLLGY